MSRSPTSDVTMVIGQIRLSDNESSSGTYSVPGKLVNMLTKYQRMDTRYGQKFML